MSDLVGNPEDRFSRVTAHIYILLDSDRSVMHLSFVFPAPVGSGIAGAQRNLRAVIVCNL